jgi:hypothetical protein
MTIRLLAHMLRGLPMADGTAAAPPPRPLDFGRWVEALVVRRWEPVAWRLQRLMPQDRAPARPEAAPGESIWADTQPWCHE